MDEIRADIAIVGAGIAGAGAAAALAEDFRVVLIEQESRPGHHTTGRSAAIFIQASSSTPWRRVGSRLTFEPQPFAVGS